MSEKDVVENVNSPGAVSIPIASNSAKGIASFNAKDFTVNNGEVSAIWERGVPQYVGIIVGQEEGEGDLTWTIDDASLIDNRPVKIGEYIMLREDVFGFTRGEVFVITGISVDENFLVTTDNQSAFSLQGEVGPKGEKGDKGDRGEQGKEGAGIADITNIDYPHGEFDDVQYDNTDGIQLSAIVRFTRDDGEAYDIPATLDIPVIPGDGILIDKINNKMQVEVKVDGKVTKTPNSIVKRDSAGRVKTADATSDEDATSYGQQKAFRTYIESELLKKLDRIGGTITGNLIVSGNLSVSGEASVIESTTLKVADKLIYVAKDNTSALTSPAGLITPKYDGTNDGGIVYDNSGTAYVGDIKLDSDGNVDVNNSDLQPIATRDVYSNFINGHKVKAEVDSSQKNVKFIDGGKDDGINSLTDVNLTLDDTTVLYDATNGIQLTSTGRFTYADGTHDATINLDLPIIGTNGIVIDKVADSEKIEVSGKNLLKDPYPGANVTGAGLVNYKSIDSTSWGTAFIRNTHALVENAEYGAIVGYDNYGVIYAKTTSDDNYSVVNREYADKNYRKVATGSANEIKVYVTKYGDTESWMFLNTDPDGTPGAEIPQYGTGGTLRANMPTTPFNNSVINKEYAEDHFLKVYDSEIIGPGEVKIPGMRSQDGATNTQVWYSTCVGEYVANSAIALTDSGGHLGTTDPTAGKHCVNKEYADANYRKALETEVGQWKIYASMSGDSNGYLWAGPEVLSDQAVVVRGNNGCIYTNMPNAANTKDTTVPNKKYVEDAIANIPLKTLFGNQDIHGIGNIDLYRHNIRIKVSASGFGAEIYFTYYSSNNLQVDSLTDLKTLMGDTFVESVSGNTSTSLPVQYITESAFNVQGQNYTWASMTSITITDGVKTI